MSLKRKIDFPVNLLPFGVLESKVLRPTEARVAIGFTNIQSGDLMRIIMETLKFPFIPHVQDNKLTIVLFSKQTRSGMEYITQEQKEIHIDESNINFIKCIWDTQKINNINYYNNAIFNILLKLLNINNGSFAIYGRDFNGRFAYLTFQIRTKIPMIHYIEEKVIIK